MDQGDWIFAFTLGTVIVSILGVISGILRQTKAMRMLKQIREIDDRIAMIEKLESRRPQE